MEQNELKFYEFWKQNCKGKTSVETKYITESYFYLYKKQYVGGTCSRCLSIVSAELKRRFEYFENKIEKEKESDSLVNQIVDKKIEPVNKTRGWHLKSEYIDDEGNVFCKGKYIKTL